MSWETKRAEKETMLGLLRVMRKSELASEAGSTA